jgi:CspA family cold shock protein
LNERMTGTVKWFDSSKGYGIIQPETENVEEVFVYYTAIVDNGFKNLYKGDKVEFAVVDDPRGPQAINVVRQ